MYSRGVTFSTWVASRFRRGKARPLDNAIILLGEDYEQNVSLSAQSSNLRLNARRTTWDKEQRGEA